MGGHGVTIDDLERWVLSGAQWRVVDISREHAVVDMCTCTGEPVDRVESDDPAVIVYLRTARSEPDGSWPAMAAIAAPTSFEEPYEAVGIKHRTATIAELWLRPLASILEYQPGEYVLLADDRGGVPPRSFSVANAPRSEGLISLLVTRVSEGETSLWVHDRLRVGQTVSISGPYGTFVDDPAATAPALFLAAGSGLAPIRALVEAALARAGRRELTLIFSARTEADVIDRERFQQRQAENERFRFIRTLTRGAGPHARGRIPALLPNLYADLSGHDVFVAGAPGFVRACATAAEALGCRREHVHTEVFFVEPQPWTGESAQVGQRA